MYWHDDALDLGMPSGATPSETEAGLGGGAVAPAAQVGAALYNIPCSELFINLTDVS